MATFELTGRGPFDLGRCGRWLEGFRPAGLTGGRHLHIATPAEGVWRPAAVCLSPAPNGLRAEVAGDAPLERVREQVRRMFSLDVDAGAWPAICHRDPVLARLDNRFPGLRPVCFPSPYEAAVWAVLSQRMRMAQAAALKRRLTDSLGTSVAIHGEEVRAFPPPATLMRLRSFPGMPAAKADRLMLVAAAALDGLVDGAALRSVDAASAIGQLRRIPGIGTFSAELIAVRGAGHPDHFPHGDKRLHDAMRSAYEMGSDAPLSELEAVADAWRPFRSWAAFLLRTAAAQGPGDDAGEERGGS
ncbi:MAG TPA: DNA-3-methyladenine glycosylase 2 family protein [Actinomycetota bacterium]|jgi:DNA-3-methyladenine glycosylase II|nr:DNA-3-methyladenine glycosylase 2 family protein [Actinomycetota bacterium]